MKGERKTLRELLKEADCSISRLARAVGVSRGCVDKWIDGLHVPGVDKAAKVAKVLGFSLDQIAACFEESDCNERNT